MGQVFLLAGLAAAAAQAAPTPPPVNTDTLEAIVVEGRVPIVGDLQKGVLAFNPAYFTKVRPTTALDMVQWLPGFGFQDTRDVRGLEGSGGNVLIDGKPPTSKTDTLQAVLRRIPSEQVDRVDIIVGGAPGIDMHGFSVIANVVLKKSATRRKTFTVATTGDRYGRVGPSATFNSTRKFDGKTFEYSFEGGQQLGFYPGQGNGAWVRTGPAGAPVFTAEVRDKVGGPYAIGSTAYEQPLAGGTLRFNGSGRYYGTTTRETDTLTSGGPGVYGFTHDQTYLQGEAGVAYEHPLGKRTTLETQGLERLTHYTAYNVLSRPPSPSILDKAQDLSETVLRATVRFKPSDRLTFATSAEGALNDETTSSKETLNGASVALPTAAVDVKERRGEVGETVSWKPNGKVSFDGAMKVESSTLTGQGDTRISRSLTYVKPRAVFTWSPSKDLQLRLRGEHEVGQINIGYFVAGSNFATGEIQVGNVNIRPSRDWLSEAVLERRFWTGGSASVTLRYKHYIDLLDAAPFVLPSGNVIGRYANIGDGDQTEAVFNLTLPFKKLGLEGATLKGGVTWTRSQVDDPVTGRPRRFTGQAPVYANLHFVEDLPALKLNVGIDAFYDGAYRVLSPAFDQSVGAWARFNLFVEYRAGAAWNLRAEVDNLPGTKVPQIISAYSGLRTASPLLYRDDQRLGVGPTVLLRVRRTYQ